MVPTQQRFKADKPTIIKRHYRLIMHCKLVSIDSVSKVEF